MLGKVKSRILLVTCMLIVVFLIYNQNSGDQIIAGWPPDKLHDIGQYLLKDNELAVDVLPDDFCSRKLFVLTMIFSSPTNFEHRLAVRNTYAAYNIIQGEPVSYYFLLGRSNDSKIQGKVKRESRLYGDTVQGDFIDSYNNLTLKTVFMVGIVAKHCQNAATFLLKTDDDTYVNIELLVKDFKRYYTRFSGIIGHVYYLPKRITSRWNKWYAPDYMYANETFPDFVSGTGYVVSTNILGKLYSTALATPYLHLEDVFMTGIVAAKNNITRKWNRRFLYAHGTQVCNLRKYYTTHNANRLSPSELLEIHRLLHDNETMYTCDHPPFSIFGWLFGITWF